MFIEPGSPWENGYIESFNGKLRDELLDDRFRQFEKFGMGWVGGPVGRWAARTVYSSYQLRDAIKVARQKKVRSKAA